MHDPDEIRHEFESADGQVHPMSEMPPHLMFRLGLDMIKMAAEHHPLFKIAHDALMVAANKWIAENDPGFDMTRPSVN